MLLQLVGLLAKLLLTKLLKKTFPESVTIRFRSRFGSAEHHGAGRNGGRRNLSSPRPGLSPLPSYAAVSKRRRRAIRASVSRIQGWEWRKRSRAACSSRFSQLKSRDKEPPWSFSGLWYYQQPRRLCRPDQRTRPRLDLPYLPPASKRPSGINRCKIGIHGKRESEGSRTL